MSVLKKLAGQTAIYGLTTIIGRFLNFLLTPLHTAVLLPSQYGVVMNVYAYMAFLNVIFTYGMETAYFRFATKNDKDEDKIFANTFLLIFISTVFFSGLIYFNANDISQILGFYSDPSLIKWVAGILAIDALTAIPFAKLRLQKRVFLFSTAKITSIFLNIGLNVFFLYICPAVANQEFLIEWQPFVDKIYTSGNPLKYIFIANLIANLAFLPFLIQTFRNFEVSINTQQTKEMFKYAFPILVMGIAGTINEMFSRIMLEKLLPPNFYSNMSNMEVLGVFGACYKMAIFMTISIQAFRFASEPFFFSQAKDKNAPQLYAKVMHYFVAICMVLFLGVSLNANWISGLLIKNEVYKTGLAIVPILLLSNVFMGIYFNLSVWYKLTDKTYYGTYITIAGAAITIIANYFLIPYFGYMGCVWASLCSFATMAVVSYFLGQKNYPIPYNLFLLSFLILFAIALYFVLDLLFIHDFNHFIIKNISILAYVGLATIILKKYT